MDKDPEEDEDYEDNFYDEPVLSWKNYTKYNEILPDENTCTLFIMDTSENQVIDIKKDFIKFQIENNLRIEEDLDNSIDVQITKIFDERNQVLFFYHSLNCLIVRILDKNLRKALFDLFNKRRMKVIEVPHSLEKFRLENTDITAISRTGIFSSDEEFLPRTFYQFRIGRNLIAKALLEYFEGEFGFYAPTLLMFEVIEKHRRQGIGSRIIHTIECMMKDLGFSELYLADTKSMNFWRKMGYEIDIDEGSKSLKRIKCGKYGIKS